MNERSQGVGNVCKEWDPGAGQVSQDSNRAGSEGVPGPGERTGGGGDQSILHPSKKRKRLDDNDIVGDNAVMKTLNDNRKQQSLESGCSGKRKHFKPKKRRNNRQTEE